MRSFARQCFDIFMEVNRKRKLIRQNIVIPDKVRHLLTYETVLIILLKDDSNVFDMHFL